MPTETATPDLLASDVAWDLEPLVEGRGPAGVDELLDEAAGLADELTRHRGHVAELDAAGLAGVMRALAEVTERIERAGSYASLRFSVDTADPERGALMQHVEERATAIGTELLFFELEWAALPDDAAEALLSDDGLEFCAHYLRSARRYRAHLLSEPEERIMAEKAVTGRGAWSRLFSELTSAITVDLDGETLSLEQGLSQLQSPDRQQRLRAAKAVSAGLQPGLRTRAYVFNTLLADKSTDDRLRHYSSWLTSMNLANEASDESVEALVAAVRRRYDIPQRWYSLKARLLGVDRLADYDRMASVADSDQEFGWSEAKELVLDAYASFSPELAGIANRFFDESWIDAPIRPGKRPGAFCAYTVPSLHPYLLLNWTARRRDVLTLAHEMGHGLHAYLARGQGVFHQGTPLTLAETASVFGETVTFGRLLSATDDPNARLALLAESLEGQIATVFRQTAMNQFMAVCRNTVASAVSSASSSSTNGGPRRRPRCSATRSRSPRVIARGGRTFRISSARPDTSTPTRTASCSPCLCTGPTRSRAASSCPATSTCSRAEDRARPKSSATSWASTSPTPGSGTAGCRSWSRSSRRPRRLPSPPGAWRPRRRWWC
jgi:oligoendopeptidase F